jgi:hypothetical protein
VTLELEHAFGFSLLVAVGDEPATLVAPDFRVFDAAGSVAPFAFGTTGVFLTAVDFFETVVLLPPEASPLAFATNFVAWGVSLASFAALALAPVLFNFVGRAADCFASRLCCFGFG